MFLEINDDKIQEVAIVSRHGMIILESLGIFLKLKKKYKFMTVNIMAYMIIILGI